ncbi:MAG: ABC transporter ATP-binding protein/permease [Bryobacteraceae bacterium]|nr:ABC transporter ATP-binding protein/permease [Bryobacteraceae bacterium]
MTPEFRRALAYLAPHRGRLAAVLALSSSGTALSLAIPYLSKRLVDDALLQRNVAALQLVVLLFVLVTLGSFAINTVSGMLYTRVSAAVLFDMRLAVYRHLQTLSPRFYARTRLGDILSRINTDIAEIQRTASDTALAWVGNVLFLAGAAVMLVVLDWRLFVAAAAPVPFAVWALRRYRDALEARVSRMREAGAAIGSFLIETLRGMKLVVTSHAEEHERRRFAGHNDAFVRSLLAMQRTSYLRGGVPGLLLAAGTAVVFLWGGVRVISGEMTLGTLVAFLAYQGRLLAPIQALMGLFTGLAAVQVSLRRVQELLDEKPEVTGGSVRLASRPGCLNFDAVSFAFDRQPLLESASFELRPGETLAVVGDSGAGKSTIADLAVRLLDPASGRITLDGIDLRDLHLGDLRRAVVLVEQEPFFFHAPIAENLRYGSPGATDEDIRRACKQAGIHDLIESWPRAYETIAGEEGLALSSGERQRLALARAVLRDPAVLVLDEPSAALDPAGEKHVLEALRGRTALIITHRLEVARAADRVLLLREGRLLEEPAAVARFFEGAR